MSSNRSFNFSDPNGEIIRQSNRLLERVNDFNRAYEELVGKYQYSESYLNIVKNELSKQDNEYIKSVQDVVDRLILEFGSLHDNFTKTATHISKTMVEWSKVNIQALNDWADEMKKIHSQGN